MSFDYPLTYVESDGQNFKQFVIPVQINGSPCFGLLDTGASITTVSYEVATNLNLDISRSNPDGEATFVGGFPYYYSSIGGTIDVLPPNKNLLDDMWAILLQSNLEIADYYDEMAPIISVENVPIRCLTKPLAVFAQEANWDHPDLRSRTKSLPPIAILGVEGFIDSISFETLGSEEFRLSGPD